MDKSLLNNETLDYIRQIVEMKGITEQEAMAAVINNYAGEYARLVKASHVSAERAREN